MRHADYGILNRNTLDARGQMKHDPQREVIARAIVIVDGRVLVNRARNMKTGEDYLALPGGHVDAGESCVEAVRREFREELEVDLSVGELCLVSESIYPGRRAADTRRHELVLYFHGELVTPLRERNGRILSPERKKQFQWLAVADLPAANLLPHAVESYLLSGPDVRVPAAPGSPHYVFEDSTAG